MREGHICIPITEEEISTAFGKVSLSELEKADCKTLARADAPVPFIFKNPYLYTQRYYRYETQVVEWIKERIKISREKRNVYSEKILQEKQLIFSLAATYNVDHVTEQERSDWQLLAVIRTLLNDFSIITGGPGTGKTTTLSKLLLLIYTLQKSARVAIAAPTGKASMRMQESLKDKSKTFPEQIKQMIDTLKPYTLHRLLGYQKNSIYFRHNKDNQLPYDWIIVDEASMIDLPMFAKLLSACGPDTRLLLLGDKDQLASVEAGSLLGDLCMAAGELNCFRKEDTEWLNGFIADNKRSIPRQNINEAPLILSECITELKYSHRFTQQGAIGNLSRAIIQGDIERTTALLQQDRSGQISIFQSYNSERFDEFIKGYTEFLEEQEIAKALLSFNKLRVLVTVREGESGLYAINRKIEKTLHNIRPELIKPTSGFYHNRPVIITKNNYELELYNGDIGIVRRDSQTRKLRVWFDSPSGIRSFSPDSLNDCETVFAMTIHKSQGSEFKNVMVVLPNNIENPLLTRELLYTGVTRAIDSVIIMGEEEVLVSGIQKRVERISGINNRMNID
jgi:exodeoxyribonuclease V alpha subunit